MKQLFIAAFMLLILAGCSTSATAPAGPVPPAPPGLWYAEQEIPDQFHYHVYVLFKGDGHFQWWRTKEDQPTVLRRMTYYRTEHPGWQYPTAYTRQGNTLTGERRIDQFTESDMRGHMTIQKFAGQFSGDALDMTITDYWITDKTAPMPAPLTVYRWKLKRLGAPLGE